MTDTQPTGEIVRPTPMLHEDDVEWHDADQCDGGCEFNDCTPVRIPKDPERRRRWADEHGFTDEEKAAVEEYVRICEAEFFGSQEAPDGR